MEDEKENSKIKELEREVTQLKKTIERRDYDERRAREYMQQYDISYEDAKGLVYGLHRGDPMTFAFFSRHLDGNV
jgi:hypothetical protein